VLVTHAYPRLAVLPGGAGPSAPPGVAGRTGRARAWSADRGAVGRAVRHRGTSPW